MTSKPMRYMKWLSVELWIEKVEETGILEPALESHQWWKNMGESSTKPFA